MEGDPLSTEMLIEMGRIEVAATAIYVTVCGLDRRAIYRYDRPPTATVPTCQLDPGVRDGTTTRALVADWKNGDSEMAAIAEVIASALASGCPALGRSKDIQHYCPLPNGGVYSRPGYERCRPADSRSGNAGKRGLA